MLNGKIILITGASGFLGQEFVASVVAQNGIVVVGDRNEEKGQPFAQRFGDRAFFAQLDITNKKSIQACLDLIMQKYGRLDAVVNNAYPRNANYGRHFFDVEYADFCDNVSQHLGGYFLVAQTAAELFKKQGYGNIVNISSIYGIIPPKFEIYDGTEMTMPVEYAAIKSGVVHLTRYMAKYFKGMQIRVNSLSPGGLLNGQPEAFVEAYKNSSLNKGMLDPKDVCGSLVFLLSDHSLAINGQNLTVDDGFSL